MMLSLYNMQIVKRVKFIHFLVSVSRSILVQLYFYLTIVQNIFWGGYVYFGSGTGFGYTIVSACPSFMACNLLTFVEII